jgi:Skp family chaperone for outer membrane proteins
MVLVSDPYFNEPGFESSMHTARGKEESRKYNEGIRLATARHAILGALTSPSATFKQALEAHWQLKGQQVLETLRQWVLEAKKPGELAGVVKQVEAALEKLGKNLEKQQQDQERQRQQQEDMQRQQQLNKERQRQQQEDKQQQQKQEGQEEQELVKRAVRGAGKSRAGEGGSSMERVHGGGSSDGKEGARAAAATGGRSVAGPSGFGECAETAEVDEGGGEVMIDLTADEDAPVSCGGGADEDMGVCDLT